MIKAIIFDFGNVVSIFDNSLFVERISQCAKKSPQEVTDLIYVKSDIIDRFEGGEITPEEFFKEVSDICQLDMTQEDFYKAYVEVFSQIDSTIELIKKLKHNYKVAVLSDVCPLRFEYGLKKVPIFELFDAVTLSFEVGAMKPDEKIYQDSLEKLNVAPEEAVFIDDLKENAEGATHLGIHGIQYLGHDELLKSLGELGVNF